MPPMLRTNAQMLAMDGMHLSAEEAAQMEDHLTKAPDDLQALTKLLGYYQMHRFGDGNGETMRTKHIVWLIQHHPDSEILGTPNGTVEAYRDATGFELAKTAWLEAVKKHDHDAHVLGNAAQFFYLNDRKLSEDLLKKANQLEPNNPQWADKLAHLYVLNGIGKTNDAPQKALRQFERADKLGGTPLQHFYRLDDLAKSAYAAGDLEKASKYATELLALAKEHAGDWNCGNAIHHGNLVLGRIALKQGDVKKASDYLLKAGETTGSPQLDSFGPNMALAKELLEKGEKEPVLKYFEQCRTFWKMDQGKLDEWKSDVTAGKTPDFSGNLLY
jgi:tetratricopeptide (TPR) repeat protein